MKYKFRLTYKGPKTERLYLESEWMEEQKVESFMIDFQKSGRIVDVQIVDEMNREWTQKEFLKLMKKVEDEPRNPILFFDGGYNLQTQEAGIGIVIYYQKGEHQYRYRSNSILTNLSNNNEAEYVALYNALIALEEIGCQNMPVTVKGDSQGLIKQLQGEWPCYEKTLNDWLDRIDAKIDQLGLLVHLELLSRSENKEADQLASQALAKQSIHSHAKVSD